MSTGRFADAGGDAELLEQLAARIPQPVDPLEVAAVIESMGITDRVAAELHGARNVFDLADRVYPELVRLAARRLAASRVVELRSEEAREAAVPVRDASGRGLLSIAPLAILVLLMQLLGRAGWSTAQVLSMCLGASLAMILTAGPVLAIGRRTAIYVGFGHDDPARRFAARSAALALTAAVAVSLALVGLGGLLGIATRGERIVFGLTAVAFALLSVLSSALAVARLAWCPPLCFAGGVVAGTAVGLATTTDAGVVTGFAVAAAGLAVAWNLVFRGDADRPLRLPATGPLVVEAAPYLAYGTLFALFFLEPHVLGWLGGSDGTTLDRLRVFELSFLLALPSVLLAAGVHELAMEAFWLYTRSRKWRDGRASFTDALRAFHRGQIRRYTVVLGAITVVAVAVVEGLLLGGVLHGVSQAVFLAAAGATALMGIGQFNCLFMMSLARPAGALLAALAGIATATAVGVPLATADYRLAAVACLAGAGAFAAVAWLCCRQLIADVDHHYATAF